MIGINCSSETAPISTTADQTSDSHRDNKAIQFSDALQRQELSLTHQESKYKIIVYKLQTKLVEAKIHNNLQPKRLDEWHDQLEPNILINGGFFNENNEPTGYFVEDGNVISSKKYDYSKSGSLVIQNGIIDVVDTEHEELPTVDLEVSILQSFPLLIKPGGQPGIQEDSNKLARRTVIAKNFNGEILIIIVDQTPISLHRLMDVLLNSDLNIDIAMNLDGGPSSGILLAEPLEKIPAISPLPVVITVHKRFLTAGN